MVERVRTYCFTWYRAQSTKAIIDRKQSAYSVVQVSRTERRIKERRVADDTGDLERYVHDDDLPPDARDALRVYGAFT